MDGTEDVEMKCVSEDDSDDENVKKKVYLPGQPLEEGEDLVCDESAYIMFHRADTGDPCLSFDIIQDGLGNGRTEYPMTAFIVAGTQAPRIHANSVLVIKMSQLFKTNPDEEDESSDESEDEEKSPEMLTVMAKHEGCVNRIRVTVFNHKPYAASWSELGNVHIWDLSDLVEAVDDDKVTKPNTKPVFTFRGHQVEGFAVDWCPTVPGVLATGDCNKHIHLWKPVEGSMWHVDQRPFTGHTQSVEDIQWSPNEASVFASCSVDQSIRIWDTRAAHNKACMLSALNAHENDVNVIHWNRNEPFIVSGGDDGKLLIWDLRKFQEGTPVATFKHHSAPITTVEWHPSDSTVFASAGTDDQLPLWDLSVERDTEAQGDSEEGMQNLLPQLLFIHQGQKDIKELHWHPQIPGMIISTAQTGFNIFKTISV